MQSRTASPGATATNLLARSGNRPDDDFPDIDVFLALDNPIDLTEEENMANPTQQSPTDSSDRRQLQPRADDAAQGFEEWNGFDDNYSGSDTSEDGETPDPPSVSFCSDTIEELQTAVNNWAKEYGFAVVHANGRNKDEAGKYTRYEFQCDRFGNPRPPRGAGLRKTAMRKCGCRWKGYTVKTSNGWIYRNYTGEAYNSHNHPPSLESSAHPQHRKCPIEVVESIATISSHPSIRPREVRNIIYQQYPELPLTDKDIYNVREKLKLAELQGRGPMGALVAFLDAEDPEKKLYRVKWVDDEEGGKVEGIIFTFPLLMDIAVRSWEALQADMTYKTNLYGYPLFQVTSLSACNTSFNFFYAVVQDETKASFGWLVAAMKELLEANDIKLPLVFITDYCRELKASLAEVLPDTQQQICILHIIMNVLLNAKRKRSKPVEVNSDDEEGLDDSLSAEAASLRRLAQQERADNREEAPQPPPTIPHNHHGVEALFKAMVYADSVDRFWGA